MSFRIVDEWEGGFGWVQDEFMQRTSHALVVDDRVWLVDPVADLELADRIGSLGEPAGILQLLDRHERGCAPWAARLGVPVLRGWESAGGGLVEPLPFAGSPFEVLPVLNRRWWREVALWEPRSHTLVCADALGTAGYFRAGAEPIGVHPILRLFPPTRLGAVAPDRILVGHGPALTAGAGAALDEALRTARRRLPKAWLAAIRTDRAARRDRPARPDA